MLLNNLSLIYIISSFISIILSVYAFNKKRNSVSIALGLLLAGISIWSLFYGIEIASTNLNLMLFCLGFEYIGISTIPVIWFLYAAHYTQTDSKLTLAVKLTLFIVPAITLLMVNTNNYHYLFYSTSEIEFSNNLWFHKMEAGPFYWVHIVYSYIAVIAGVLLFGRMYFKVSKESRFNIGIILTSVLIPYFVSIAYITGFKPFGFLDMTPVGFLLMGVILLFGALGNKLFDVTPLALSTMFDSIPDAIFVYDENFEFVNSNPTAKHIVKTHFQNNPEKFKVFILSYKSRCADSLGYTEIEIDESIYKATCKSIFNKNGRISGNMILLSDITSEKNNELRLIESEEQHRLLFETAQEAIVVVQEEKLVYFNPVFEQMSGYSKNEILDVDFADFVYDADKQLVENNFNKSILGQAQENNFQFRIHRKDEKICWVNISFVKFNWNGKVALLNFLSDITDQIRISEFQFRLMSIADRFINTQFSVLDKTINESLNDMGLFIGADRAYIFDYDWTNEICVNTYEWCDAGITSQIDNLQAVPLSMIPDWIDTHKNNEYLFIGNVFDLSEDNAVRQVLEPQGIKSLLAIPLIDNNCCIGFVGFDFVLKYHDYSEKEKSLLHMFAQMLVNVLNRKSANELIAEQIETQKIITEISKDFISAESSNINAKINSMLEKIGLFFRVDRTYILRYSEDGLSESNTNEWCANEITHQIEMLNNINISEYPWWVKQMDEMQVINVPDVTELPEDAINEKTEFQRQDIKSILCVPVINNNKVIGFLGLDAVLVKTVWSDNQISTIYIIANIIGDALIKVKSEEELRKTVKLAEAASVAKSDFLSNMSHEIRTPLNGVIGFTDLLRNTSLDKVQQEYLENAITSANSLLSVISDILDFSKIEAGKLDLDLTKNDLIELVENTADIIKIQAAKKHLELLLDIQPDIPRYALIDSIRLKQIIVNLLSNAVKFTNQGEVELKLTFQKIDAKTGKFSFKVRDTGIGVKEEDKSKLFKAFSQADTSATRRYGGTGLGLIISNSLAQKMGGPIHFESEYGTGSSFTFDIQTEFENGKLVDKSSFSHIKNVLIVDDNANNRMILEHTFNYWDISTIAVKSGYEALALLEKINNFDVIIIDYNMPELNGLETIQLIREKFDSKNGNQTIILFHSSSDDYLIHETARNLNVKFVLTKPIKSNELYQYLINIGDDKIVDTLSDNVNNEVAQDNYKIIESAVKILVVEDTAMNMLVITKMLKNFLPNVEIIEAINGKEALTKLETIVPDLILMDVQMPVLDGIATTEKIKSNENEKIRVIPIIALTAGVSKEERETCYKVGMIDFISKPIEKKILYEKVISNILTTFAQIIENEINVNNVDVCHFNKESLLKKIGNDSDLYITLINTAMVEYPAYFERIKLACIQNDSKIIITTAHSLRGNAYNMEFNLLGDLAHEIELNANNTTELDEILNKVLIEWNFILSLLNI